MLRGQAEREDPVVMLEDIDQPHGNLLPELIATRLLLLYYTVVFFR